MNNTFEFSRFKKLLNKELRDYFPNFGPSLLVMWALPVGMLIINLLFGGATSPTVRYVLINCIVMLALVLAPEKLYGKANLPRQGVAYAMIPASALEKFLSQFLFCVIVTPIVYFAGAIVMDAILYILPFGGFNESVFNVFQASSDLFDFSNEGNEIADSMPSYLYYASAIGMISTSGLFMLGNMLFKSHKTIKTILCSMMISFLVFIISVVVMARVGDSGLLESLLSRYVPNEELKIDFIQTALLLMNIVNTIVCIGILIGTYFKIKTQKY